MSPALFTRQDNSVSLASHNVKRNSEDGCFTVENFLLSVESLSAGFILGWGIGDSPQFLEDPP